MENSNNNLENRVQNFRNNFFKISQEVQKCIVGMEDIVTTTLSSIFANGHVLLEGVPGLGKTLLVKTISKVLNLEFKRIQFTPDLMPTDLTGTLILSEDENKKRDFTFKRGPIFSHIVLADEINRTTPKTQSALLEAMEERQVSSFDTTYKLKEPFFVLATQNPIELEGTYPLPEAQLDRFLTKLILKYPAPDCLKEIIQRTTGNDETKLESLFKDPIKEIFEMKLLVKEVIISNSLLDIVIKMIEALNPTSKFATSKVKNYVSFPPGPRGVQSLIMLSKVFALLDGRINISFDDIKKAFLPTLRHRLILNFQADTDNVTSDDVLLEIITTK
ncbi:MAG: AAA family ATPase [Bdellovibrionota bacterium]|nr:AAA family ATPase [Pseudomonadota bacterium]MDY6089835.1 AAA family ATPase [Bdellovibrionota bacterium]